MYITSLFIAHLASLTKHAVCALNESTEMHYTVNGANDGLVCAAKDRSFYPSARSETGCAVACLIEPYCQSWVFKKDGLVCNTCAYSTLQAEMLPGGKSWQLSGCGQEIDLVSGPYGVPDQAITASTSYDAYLVPSKIKFTYNGWAAAYYDSNQYVQISFPESRVVTRVCTKGLDKLHVYQYVKSYRLLFGQDCDTLKNVLDDSGNPRVFPGNVNPTTAVCANLTPAIRMKCLRVKPLTANDWIAMRFEAIGCIL